jgi:hypothetical protein
MCRRHRESGAQMQIRLPYFREHSQHRREASRSDQKHEDLKKAGNLFDAIVNICIDKECTRPFANLKTLRLLIDFRKKVGHFRTTESIDSAMSKIVSYFPEFLDFCAAQFEATAEYQDQYQFQLLRAETLEQLATFLEYDFNALFQKDIEVYVQQRSLLIICEKLDQFILSREENEENGKEFQKILAQISIELFSGANAVWEKVTNHQFFDTVIFSLLQHGPGETCVDTANFVRRRIRKKNSPALSSSMLKVILEKIDEEDEETCFEWEINGECFFSVGIQLLRHAVSENSKDLSKSFFVDNLDLINRVFNKGKLLGDENIQEEISGVIEDIRKFDPRTKQAPQISIERESGQRRDRDGNPSTLEKK